MAGNRGELVTPPWAARVIRRLLRGYALHSPLGGGKGLLVETVGRWLARHEPVVLARVGSGYWMELDLRDYVQRLIYFFSYYEAPVARYLLELLRPGMTFVDVGAHVGQYTLLAGAAVGPAGRVFAFEPEARNFERLTRNIQLNALENVEARNVAVADESGAAPLYVAGPSAGPGNWGLSSLARRESGSGEATVQVRVSTLDEALHGAARVDVVKIDVEGAELMVLKGARRTVRTWKPVLLIEAEEKNTSRFGYGTVELKRFLEDLHYKSYSISPKTRSKQPSFQPTRADAVEEYRMLVAIPETCSTGRG